MRDVYEVLREKESAVQRVKREMEALRLVALMLYGKKTPDERYMPTPIDQTSSLRRSRHKKAVRGARTNGATETVPVRVEEPQSLSS